jgi:hypothetical protein
MVFKNLLSEKYFVNVFYTLKPDHQFFKDLETLFDDLKTMIKLPKV